MISLQSLPPLSLYVHIPWCVRKCPYCDFNSHAQKDSLPEDEYVDALIEDLSHQIKDVWGRRLQSIFIGGGTPSLFSAKSIDRLLSHIRALIPFEGDIEITLEANPGTAEAEKFNGFRAAGVNRLSIGVQSFNDLHLKNLGRIHSSGEAMKAIDMAQGAGFERINIDLMHGLPDQTVEEANHDLLKAINTGVTHISWYQLTMEPNTAFYQNPPTLPDDEVLVDIQEAGEHILQSHGFIKYEVSAYAKNKTQQSRHNLNYWSFGDYLAIGAGAHGKITLPAENAIVRFNQYRNPKDYLNKEKIFTQQKRNIEAHELPLEFMMNALRLVEGVPQAFFNERTGLCLQSINKQLERAKHKELIDLRGNWIKPTPMGYRFLNDLLEIFDDALIMKAIPVKKIE